MTVPHETPKRRGVREKYGVMSVVCSQRRAAAHSSHEQIAQEPVSHHVLGVHVVRGGMEGVQSMASTS